jgi:hypothetical protein
MADLEHLQNALQRAKAVANDLRHCKTMAHRRALLNALGHVHDEMARAMAAEPPEARPADPDVARAIAALEQDADICSTVNGSEDDATKEARRLETTVKRLAREAGYRCVTTD